MSNKLLVRWRLAEIGAKQLAQRLAVAHGNPLHFHQRGLPQRIERMATKSIHYWGKRVPRRIRQSGSALRKLIRSLAVAGLAAA